MTFQEYSTIAAPCLSTFAMAGILGDSFILSHVYFVILSTRETSFGKTGSKNFRKFHDSSNCYVGYFLGHNRVFCL